MERLARTLSTLGLATLVAGRAAAAGVEPPDPGPLYAAPTTLDRIGRIVAPVFVNGRGPYRFILDTGASRSVVSPRLVAELGLTPSEQSEVLVMGVTPELATGDMREAPVIEMGGAKVRELAVAFGDMRTREPPRGPRGAQTQADRRVRSACAG